MLDRFALKSVLSTVASGDRNAFTTLYQDRADHLYALTLRMLHDEDLAAEALQNTFVEIWRRAQARDIDWDMPDLEMICIARARAGDLARRSPDRILTQLKTDMADAVNDGTASFELLELLHILGKMSDQCRVAISYAFYELPTRAQMKAHLSLSDEDLTACLRRCYAEYVAGSPEMPPALDRDADLSALQQAFGLNSVPREGSQESLYHAWELRIAPFAELLKPISAPATCFEAISERINADQSTASGRANTRTSEIWRAFLYVIVAFVAAILVYFGLVAISDEATAEITMRLEETLP